MDRVAWILSELVPDLLARKDLTSNGQPPTVISCNVTPRTENSIHLASEMYMINIEVDVSGEIQKLNAIVKMENFDEIQRSVVNTKDLYANEVLVYSEIFPLLREFLQDSASNISFNFDGLFPICYNARTEDNGKSFLVLENLISQDFFVNGNLFLDYEQCVSAFVHIGRFHGLCYAFKQQKKDIFFACIDKLTDARRRQPIAFARATCLRGLHRAKLRDKNADIMDVLYQLEERFGDARTLLFDLLEPKEPLAVLCHGDFNGNNLFFQRCDTGVVPYDVKIFDLQLMRYSSPAIDTGYLAFMSMSPELRKKHWSSLFQLYHDTLVNTLALALGVSTADLGTEFSLDSFKQDFAEHAMHSYILCSIVLPFVLMPSKIDENLTCIGSLTLREMENMFLSMGDESTTEMLADMLEEIIRLRMKTTSGSICVKKC